MRIIIRILSNYVSGVQIISLILAIVFFALAASARELVLKDIMSGISASFVFLFVIEVVQAGLRDASKVRFRRFFGKHALNGEMDFVYPDFVLSPEVRKLIKNHNPQMIYQKPDSKFPQIHRIDIPRAIADNDVRALVYMVALFGEICKNTPPIKVDTVAVSNPKRSFVSFGLSSNDCTHMYLQRDSKPFFELVPDEKGSEFLRIIDELGKPQDFASSQTTYFGLIVKYHPDPEEHPDCVWFFCAGLGPNGTTGASWYLANKWRKLYEKVDKNDFVAIVKTQHYSDSETTLEVIQKR